MVAGYQTNIGLKADGTVWAWGFNYYGVVCDGTITNKSSPTSVIGNHSFIQVTHGFIDGFLALKADGSAWGWGRQDNGYYIVGDETPINRSSPTSVHGDHAFVQIAGGRAMIGLKADGSAWTWAGGLAGQAGLGNGYAKESSPVSVAGNHSFIRVMSSLTNTISGLKANGEVWAWGENKYDVAHPVYGVYDSVGDNTILVRTSPVSVVGNHSFFNTDCTASCLVKEDGSVWNWGNNSNTNNAYGYPGRLGDNTIQNRSSPTSVAMSFNQFSPSVRAIGDIQENDKLYWNSNIAGINLDPSFLPTNRIGLDYIAST